MASDNSLEILWKVFVVVGRIYNGGGDHVEQNVEDDLQLFHAPLKNEDQSNLPPGRPIGRHWSLVEGEPQPYRAACDLAHQKI